MEMELVLRFDYGQLVPWVTATGRRLLARNSRTRTWWCFARPFRCRGEDLTDRFRIHGKRRRNCVPFVLSHGPSHLPVPEPIDPRKTLFETPSLLEEWISAVHVSMDLRKRP